MRGPVGTWRVDFGRDRYRGTCEIRQGLVTACSRAAAWKSRNVDAARARGGPIPLWCLALPANPVPGAGGGAGCAGAARPGARPSPPHGHASAAGAAYRALSTPSLHRI
ncbi:MAG: hypothetical protein ACK55Z_31990, partial [bacterium]